MADVHAAIELDRKQFGIVMVGFNSTSYFVVREGVKYIPRGRGDLKIGGSCYFHKFLGAGGRF